jgi:hypothetical protein
MKHKSAPNQFLNQLWDSQQKLFNQWLDSSKSGHASPFADIFNIATQSQENFVHSCLKTQADWSKQVCDIMQKQDHLPDVVKTTVIQAQTINDSWRQLRETIWSNWFEMIKNVDPAALLDPGDYANKAIAASQEASRNLFESSAPPTSNPPSNTKTRHKEQGKTSA